MKRSAVVILSGIFLFLFLSARDNPVRFDAQAAWSLVSDLASDSMAGRRSGQMGGVGAEEFAAARFSEWGLDPAGDEGTYFQNFTIEHRNIEPGARLEILTGREKRPFYYGDLWRVLGYSGSGDFTAEIVFAGFGIRAPDKKYDDYAALVVKGKVVLIDSGTPRWPTGGLKEEAEIGRRIQTAQELGAVGILIFNPEAEQSRWSHIHVDKSAYKPDFVILSVNRDVVDFIFKETATEYRYIAQELEKGNPQPVATGIDVRIAVQAWFDEERPTRNVLAKIVGSDESVSAESVIIGAHLDHNGINPLGEILNGADDNASGSAVVMEIARLMARSGLRPRRTVVFALWAGEEQGLLGSEHYVDHPALPLEKAVAYLNMDMVGQGSGKLGVDGTYYAPEIWALLAARLPKPILDDIKPGRGGPGGSDQTAFLEKGVPAFALMTEGYHFKYHQTRDDIDLIKTDMLQKTGDFALASVGLLADETEDLIQPQRRETYYLRYLNLVNFRLEPLDRVIAEHGGAVDPEVDVQLCVLPVESGLAPADLRRAQVEELFSVQENLEKTKSLSLFESTRSVRGNTRRNKTTVLIGLNGTESFRDDPRWLRVLAGQGVSFVFSGELGFMFGPDGLSEEGKAVVANIEKSGLLFGARDLNPAQAKVLLDAAKKPFVLFGQEVPGPEILDRIKARDCALGLLLGPGEDPSVSFRKIDDAKKAVGVEHVMIANQACLWRENTRDQLRKLIAEMLKAGYGGSDLSSLFSSTFLGTLNAAKGEDGREAAPYIPF